LPGSPAAAGIFPKAFKNGGRPRIEDHRRDHRGGVGGGAFQQASTVFAPLALAIFIIAIVWPLQYRLQAQMPKQTCVSSSPALDRTRLLATAGSSATGLSTNLCSIPALPGVIVRASRRAGHVGRIGADHWKIPADIAERGIAHDASNRGRDFSVRILGSDGATWLDRELISPHHRQRAIAEIRAAGGVR
jgi:hypothetical protein